MAVTRIRAGAVKKILINNVAMGVPLTATGQLRISVDNKPSVVNSTIITTTHVVVSSEEAKTGFSGIDMHVTADELRALNRIKDDGSLVPVLIETANGDIFSSDALAIVGELPMEMTNNKITVTMEGKFFEVQSATTA